MVPTHVGRGSLDVCHGCRMGFDLDLKCRRCQRCVSRGAHPNPRRGPALPRPVQDSHCGHTAWGAGVRGRSFPVHCSLFPVRCSGDILTGIRFATRSAKFPSPRPSPHAEDPQATVAWGEGGLSVALESGAAHGVCATSHFPRCAYGFVSVRDRVPPSKCPYFSRRRTSAATGLDGTMVQS